MQAMSTVWCPVTDEITPGGMTQWKRLGFTFESCCTFCDETFEEEQFAEALKRLRTRAEKTYGLVGAEIHRGGEKPRRRRHQEGRSRGKIRISRSGRAHSFIASRL